MAKVSLAKTTASSTTKKSTKTSTGAPSQLNQSSRKGKRAWRKNVDIQDVEEGLEGMRAEERVTGKTLQSTTDQDLFQIDVTGDAQLRNSLQRFSRSQLTSTKILAERSAVPAVFSRSSTASKKWKSSMSHEEKARLLRIGKRPQKGPFNSVVDPTEFGAGSAILELSEAVKSSGTYDPWASPPEQEVIQDGLETVQKRTVKPPAVTHVRDAIQVPAVVEPHRGTSYNPPVQAHQELLLQAHEAEERRLREAEKLAEVKEKIESSRREVEAEDLMLAPGMKLQEDVAGDDDESAEGEGEGEMLAKRQPQRKTKAQREKAARLRSEKRELAERAARKRMMAMIPSAKTLRRTNAKLMSSREAERARKRTAALERLKQRGLAGQKLGKHKVPEGPVDVQLGEELSESLRALKPEGNLFRDRFLSLQQRALIEPRVPVLPKKRRLKMVEYEKHSAKRFE
ncbi:putative nop53 (60S ribosomal biogenesis) [Lyophyllum shimeji]|uniref:Ribosome biogenesis protein NOP53 n=1 Tax=Lyophyllum shimeji TaxID=47721 RepID=A0A9P3PQB6_LYOSH|nr:putative nop53 (60S ribosomal biogenesis) [Lyophyllum shimeji]